MIRPWPRAFQSRSSPTTGSEDEFAGVCRAVIRQIAPDAPLIDLTHGIGRQGIRHGALALANALPFCPPGVHLAVVDPGVGTARRPVAVTTMEEGRFLVGPDNGLLAPSIERFGGAARAIDLSALAVPAGARLGDLPRTRPVRPGRGASRARRDPRRGRDQVRALRAGRPGAPDACRRAGASAGPRPLRRPFRQRHPRPRRRRSRGGWNPRRERVRDSGARRPLRGRPGRDLRGGQPRLASALRELHRAHDPGSQRRRARPGCST